MTAPARSPRASKPRPKRAAPTPQPTGLPSHLTMVRNALDDMKAVNVRALDVRGLTDITDVMVIASGNSDRHVRSIADRVRQQAKAGGIRPFGVEGERDGEWVLVDLPDVMVHVMLPRVREFYGIEELWDRGSNLIDAAPPGKPARPARRRTAAKI